MSLNEYRNNNKLIGKYGLKYLDRDLKGILSSELILIGARSGAGKTSIANNIAIENNDKKIVLLSLENYEGDLFISEVYKEYRRINRYYLTFRDFIIGSGNINVKDENTAKQIVSDKLKNITIIPRKASGFGIKDMSKVFIEQARCGAEMFIMDHIDYFDMHNPKANENQNISDIMREIRQLQNVYKVPVILISHLKKGIKETIVPTLEDFMGTSNKVKEATTVILFAPDDEKNSTEDSHIKRTWVCIRKDRFGGYSNKVCNVGFDTKIMQYENTFEEYHINYWGTKVKPIGQESEYKKRIESLKTKRT